MATGKDVLPMPISLLTASQSSCLDDFLLPLVMVLKASLCYANSSNFDISEKWLKPSFSQDLVQRTNWKQNTRYASYKSLTFISLTSSLWTKVIFLSNLLYWWFFQLFMNIKHLLRKLWCLKLTVCNRAGYIVMFCYQPKLSIIQQEIFGSSRSF